MSEERKKSLEEQLIWVAKEGDVAKVQSLLKQKNGDPTVDEELWKVSINAALAGAASKGNADVVALLFPEDPKKDAYEAVVEVLKNVGDKEKKLDFCEKLFKSVKSEAEVRELLDSMRECPEGVKALGNLLNDRGDPAKIHDT